MTGRDLTDVPGVTDDGPADERCETCSRLDPMNCPCPPEETPMDPDYLTAFETTPIRDTEIYAPTPETPEVVAEVADERVRQVAKWGVQTRPNGTGSQWAPAADEAKRITDARMADGSATWLDILLEEVFEAAAEGDVERLRVELVQVAAVATSWVEDIDRKAAE